MKKTNLLLFTLLAITLPACSGKTAVSPIGAWELVSYGGASNPTPALPDVETSITFDEDGQFHGTVGCNVIRGKYEVEADRIAFGGINSTRMYCRDSAEQENTVIGILAGNTLTLRMDDGQLTFTSEKGVVILAQK